MEFATKPTMSSPAASGRSTLPALLNATAIPAGIYAALREYPASPRVPANELENVLA
jgi:hypothetical protein